MSTKRIHYSLSPSSETESEHDDYIPTQRKQRKPKSFSKNALIARENRLRKKRYMENLERELNRERQKNKKYVKILQQQADIIQKHEREIKYMRGVLANNADISKLLKTLHYSTGMPVGTSLNRNFTIQGNVAELSEMKIKAKEEVIQSPTDIIIKEIHPWSDAQLNGGLSPADSTLDPIFDDIDFDLPALDMSFEELADVPLNSPMDDHTYTRDSTEIDESLGVCLHISNHKISLEYCSHCHDNSNRLWHEEDPF